MKRGALVIILFLIGVSIASAFTSDNSWRIATNTLSVNNEDENISSSLDIIDQKIEVISGRFTQRLSDSLPPEEFNLSLPVNNSNSTDTTPVLGWTNSSDEHFDKYIIDISNGSDFSEINYVYNITESSTTSFSSWSEPLSVGIWYWRIQACDRFSNCIYSNDNFSYILLSTSGELGTTVTTTTSVATSGGTKRQPFSLDIIAPPTVTIHSKDIITVPLIVTNPSNDVIFDYINLSAFSDSTDITPELSLNIIPKLRPKEQRKIDLKLITHTAPGTYGITITADVIKPYFSDSVRIYANLIDKNAENESTSSKQLEFAKKFFDGNPGCSDLNEYLKQAESSLKQGKYDQALNLANNAVQSCKDLLALKEVPVKKTYTPELIIKDLLKNKNFPIIVLETIGAIIILSILAKFIKRKKRIHPNL